MMKKPIQRIVLGILAAAMLAALCACGKKTPEAGETQPTAETQAERETPPVQVKTIYDCLDTVITLKFWSDDNTLADQAHEACRRYDALLSRTREGSDVWNINHAEGQPVQVSDDTIRILETAVRISELSEGAFDVTVAPASVLWDFHSDEHIVPEADAVAQAAALIDYRKIQIEGNTVTLPAGMMIDLGGIAKGYIADAVKQMLVDHGVRNAILSFGGNVIAIGIKPEGTPWRIGIQDIDKPTGTSMMVCLNFGGSTVTSGIYERGFEQNGVWYHHILSATDGWPVQNELASVTIFSEGSMTGDALSTAAFALGKERGIRLIEDMDGAEAVFVEKDRTVTMTSGAGKYFE